jgi:hypothetical protein
MHILSVEGHQGVEGKENLQQEKQVEARPSRFGLSHSTNTQWTLTDEWSHERGVW